ncbi:hypothetical protein vseg_020347 [Gypsophila vaccaria]
MVVGMDDLGLSLSLPSAASAAATTSIAHPKNPHMGFLMNVNTINNNNNNNINIYPQTAPSGDNIINESTSSPLPLNLMISPSYHSSFLPNDGSMDTWRSHVRGIDVNVSTRVGGGGEEEEAGASSPDSTVSTVSGKRSSGDRDSGGEVEVERTSSRGVSDDEDGGGENSKKKLRLTKDQSATLEESFKEHSTLNPKQKLALAKRLGLRPRQVEVWFQNRRARTKLKQTEVDCEFLKGCCEKLTEENKRLQKEVHELRTLKLSPQFYMHMTPPTTLTMCPSCERVAGPTFQPRPNPLPRPNLRPVHANLLAQGLVPMRSADAPQLRL